jgi:predicted kinase
MGNKSLTLTVLSGLPGSGKSTAARRHSADTGAIVISRDDVRKNFDFISEGDLTLLLVSLSASLLRDGVSVVVDSWNLHPKDKARWAELARLSGATLEWVHLSTSLIECIRRDAKRLTPVGAETLNLTAANCARQLTKLAGTQAR